MKFDSDEEQLLSMSLLTSLAWTVLRPVPRRRSFPSWAWTGWLKPELKFVDFDASETCFALDSLETDGGDIIHYTQVKDFLRVQHELLDSVKVLQITAEVVDICIFPSNSMPSIDQSLCGDQNPKSEWRAMIVSDGRETVYECDVTRLATEDEMYLSASHQYIQCKGLVIRKALGYEDSHELDIFVLVWDEDGGYYERFGFLRMPRNHSMETKVETIRLG